MPLLCDCCRAVPYCCDVSGAQPLYCDDDHALVWYTDDTDPDYEHAVDLTVPRLVFTERSAISIVMAPASTGTTASSSAAVHGHSRCMVIS